MKIEAPPRVALVIETSTSFGRRLLCGIAAHLRENSPWSVYFGERGVFDPVPDWLRDWKGDGIITRTASPEIREVVAANRVPAVDLNDQLGGLGVPMILIDNQAVARLAASHLLERGFTHFGYVGDAGQLWSDRRGEAFARAVGEAGYACDVWTGGPEDLRSLRQGAWELQLDPIATWVAGLPKPVGIMACHDFRALQLLAACRLADVAVPEEAAVIGVGADDVACELAYPPLSSVVLNAWRMGYEAAALLDRLMRGGAAEATEVRIPPIDVVTRQSTDVTAIADPVVARAMRFIREHACDGINVEDVLEHLRMSRTALQDHFRRALGRSIHDVVVEARMARVKALLAETTLPIETIAERTGFKYPEYMSSILKQRTGWTPARYRQEHGLKLPEIGQG
jgi:LacI family transcriptional regulator